jgi:hypothetical protein
MTPIRHVYIRCRGVVPPLAPLYHRPHMVLKAAEKTFLLLIGGREEVVKVDRLKPHLGTEPVATAFTPTRGRPPLQKEPSTTLASPNPAASAGGGG